MSARQIAYVAVLAGLYVAIGYITNLLPNPMVPGAIIAINMTIIVIAGALLGPGPGALVGLVGTALNFAVRGSPWEMWAIIPHTIMGLVAGLLGRANQPLAAFAIIVGHTLNIIAYVAVGLLPRNQVAVGIFWTGLAVETVIDLIVIWLAVALLRPVLRSAPA